MCEPGPPGLRTEPRPVSDHHHQYLTSCSRGRRQAGDPAKQGTSASCPPLSISASAKRTSFSEGADRLFATCVVCSLVPSARPSCLPLLSRPRCNHLPHQESPSFRRYQRPHVSIDALPRIREGLFFFHHSIHRSLLLLCRRAQPSRRPFEISVRTVWSGRPRPSLATHRANPLSSPPFPLPCQFLFRLHLTHAARVERDEQGVPTFDDTAPCEIVDAISNGRGHLFEIVNFNNVGVRRHNFFFHGAM